MVSAWFLILALAVGGLIGVFYMALVSINDDKRRKKDENE